MDLWIRSQDKENTVKIINQYGLKYNDKKTIIANYQPDFTDKYDGYYEILGTYKSKERALEVLDEIQKCLEFQSVLLGDNETAMKVLANLPGTIAENKFKQSFVYQMPEE